MATNLITKTTLISKFLSSPRKFPTFCFTSAASKFSEGQNAEGETYNKEHGADQTLAAVGRRMSEMAGKLDESTDGTEDENEGEETQSQAQENYDYKEKETKQAVWDSAKEKTAEVKDKVVGTVEEAKRTVEEHVGDVMRPAEEPRDKAVDQREFDVGRRPLDERKT